MRRKSTGDYPEDWPEIAQRVKAGAGWKCVRCGHPHDRDTGHVLTVHHIDLNPANNAWWNTVALCQRCHLHVQAKVIIERPWMFEHAPWFKPYVAGFYAHSLGLPEDKEWVMQHFDDLIHLGQGRM